MPNGAAIPTSLTTVREPAALTVDGGVDLLLPPATPREVLDVFVASCNVGACACASEFVARITGVEVHEEPGRLRVHITGDVTTDDVLAEMAASAPELSTLAG